MGRSTMIQAELARQQRALPGSKVARVLVRHPSLLVGGVITAVFVFVGVCARCARIVRGETLALREKEYVEAARALGHGWMRIITRHILPHTLPAVLVIGSFYMAIAILAEAALSYIGLGVQPPAASLGQML